MRRGNNNLRQNAILFLYYVSKSYSYLTQGQLVHKSSWQIMVQSLLGDKP